MHTTHSTRQAYQRQQLDELLELLHQAARVRLQAERNAARPSVILKPHLSKHWHEPTGRSYWMAQHDGVIVFGDTPDETYLAFDDAWLGRQ